MSYILDALKKAESERKLGSIPNVHAPAPIEAAETDGPAWRNWLPWSLAAAALAILLLGLAWLQPWRQATPLAPAPTPAPFEIVTTPALPAPVEAPAPVAPPPAQAKSEPLQAKPEPIAPRPISPSPPQRPAKPTPTAPAPKAVAKTETPPAQATTASVPVKEATPIATPSEDNSIGTVRDLPQNIQAELPAIVVNGYIYAKTPSDRSVLMNQKLLHEGDQVAPGLVLEKMLPKGAILSYKGYRYRVAF
jgi:general secretion pathway protein B